MFKKQKILALVSFLLVLSVTEIIAVPKIVASPNIILIVVDTLRRDHLGVYGYSAETMPFIAEKTKTGLIFTNYFSNASETVASHGSLFSGILYDPFVSKINQSFVVDLKKAGYRTYGISANPLVSKLLQFNLGFDEFESDPPQGCLNNDFLVDRLLHLENQSGQKNPLSVYLKTHLSTTADLINPRIFNCLDKHISDSKKDPFFLFINYLDPHDPYFPHRELSLRGNYNIRDELQSILCKGNEVTVERQKELIQLYDGEIKFVDSAISQLYKWVESRKILENTIFILTSDHGELLGENSLFTHNIALYSKELEVPMIVFGKNVKRGRVNYLMSHLDTGSLILSLVSNSTKKLLKDKRRTEIIVHRHHILDGQHSWRACLPEMGRVELFRFTGIETITFFYKLQGRELIGVYDKEDSDLKNNKYFGLPVDKKRKLLKEIANLIDNNMRTPSNMDERIELQLRTLGYIK